MSVPGQAALPEEPNQSGPCASRSEIVACFEALTKKDYAVLRIFSEFTAMKFRGRVNDRDAEDLLHHAIFLALDNTRKWYPQKIDFLTFVRGCISSIASGWGKGAKDVKPADTLVSPINQHAQSEAAITLGKARDGLRGHPHAVEIFDLMSEGYTGREIQQKLKLTPAIYEAAYKWIYRTLRREGSRQ